MPSFPSLTLTISHSHFTVLSLQMEKVQQFSPLGVELELINLSQWHSYSTLIPFPDLECQISWKIQNFEGLPYISRSAVVGYWMLKESERAHSFVFSNFTETELRQSSRNAYGEGDGFSSNFLHITNESWSASTRSGSLLVVGPSLSPPPRDGKSRLLSAYPTVSCCICESKKFKFKMQEDVVNAMKKTSRVNWRFDNVKFIAVSLLLSTISTGKTKLCHAFT